MAADKQDAGDNKVQSRQTDWPVTFDQRSASLPRPGVLFAGRFRILALAGRGAFGAVYRAYDETRAGDVALKLLREDGADLGRFEREAQLLAAIRHPNVVSYLAHGVSENGRAYLAMEWLEGIDLSQWLARGEPSIRDALIVTVRAAQGLASAHALGVIHRDVKPSNLFLVNSDPDKVRVIDFGVARAPSSNTMLTATGAVIGTPAYMAPEQTTGARVLTASVDVYALGCVLFECLIGATPSDGSSSRLRVAQPWTSNVPRPSERRPEVSPVVDALLARMLAHDPSDRFADAGAVALASAAVLSDLSGQVQAFVSGPVVTDRVMRTYSSLLVRAVGSTSLPKGLDAISVGVDGKLIDCSADFILLVFDGDSAVESARRAVQGALLLRSRASSLVMGIATARSDTVAMEPRQLEEQIGSFLGKAPEGALLLDATTANLLEAEFEIQHCGAVRTLTSVRMREIAGNARFSGRARELAALEGLCREAIVEQCACVAVVLGEAGVGKTRLLDEMLLRLQRVNPDVIVLKAFGDRPSSTLPFALIAQFVRCANEMRRNFDGLEVPLRVALSGSTVSQIEWCFLDELAGDLSKWTDRTTTICALREPMVMADAFRSAWLSLVNGLLQLAPVLLTIEDLHYGDVASLRLIEAAVKLFGERSLLVVATSRPDVIAETSPLLQSCEVEQIILRPLRAPIAAELVRSVAANASSDTVARIVARAAGNPFCLLELARHSETSLPFDSALSAIGAGFTRLDSFTRRVLRAGSVFGLHFTLSGLSALLDFSARADEIHHALGRAEEEQFIARDEGRGWRFRHSLVQEAAYDSLTVSERSAAHVAAGRLLAQQPGIAPSIVAWHFERGGEREGALSWYYSAARAALEGRDLERVSRLSQFALDCKPEGEQRAKVLLLGAEAALLSGNSNHARQAAAQAMASSAPGSATWTRAMGIQITSAGQLGDNVEVARLADVLQQQPTDTDVGAEWVIGLCRAATQLLSAGDHARSRAMLDAAERPTTDDLIATAWLKRLRAGHCTLRNDYDEAIALQREAARLHAASGDIRNACVSRVLLASVYIFAVDFDSASEELDVAESIARRTGAEYFLRWAAYARGKILALDGEPSIAREHLERVRHSLDGSPRMIAGTHLYAALAAFRANDGAWAEKEARAALAAHDAPAIQGVALAALARAAAMLGRGAEALRASVDASAILKAVGTIEENEALIHLAAIEAAVACGLSGQARCAAKLASKRLSLISAKLAEPARRERYLYGIEFHAQTMRLAQQLQAS
jgi:hypothetical protein